MSASDVVTLKPRPAFGGVAGASLEPVRGLGAALRANDVGLLPNRRDEAWRWSDLRGALRTLPPSSPEGAAVGEGPFAGLAADDVVLVVNGRTQSQPPSQDGAGAAGERVLAIRVIGQGDGSHAAQLAVDVAAQGVLTLLESYEGAGAYVGALDLAITLGEGARLERIVLMDEPADAVTVSTTEVALSPGAVFGQTVVTTGARLQRHETRVRHPGGGAALRMDGVYALDGRRHADFTTLVEHGGETGATTQLAKGVVAGRARGVFQGKIVVAPGADGTDARMRHSTLILSDGAEVDAKPELEIYADDVQCAHGNTVGALDEDLLFYIRSRGLPEADARALLTEAFLGEVVERIGHAGAREAVAAFVAARLKGLAL